MKEAQVLICSSILSDWDLVAYSVAFAAYIVVVDLVAPGIEPRNNYEAV